MLSVVIISVVILIVMAPKVCSILKFPVYAFVFKLTFSLSIYQLFITGARQTFKNIKFKMSFSSFKAISFLKHTFIIVCRICVSVGISMETGSLHQWKLEILEFNLFSALCKGDFTRPISKSDFRAPCDFRFWHEMLDIWPHFFIDFRSKKMNK